MPIERFQDVGQRQALARLIQPFVLRRTKAEVATELPPRTDIRRDVILSRDERRLYDAARLEALQAVTGTTETRPEQKRFQVLAALTRLRQLACHPKLLDPQSSLPSAKLEALRHLVADLRAEGHKALVFSQFTRHLDLVEAMLTEDAVTFRRLDGSTAERQRRDEVDAFQRGEADVFLLSLKAGGTGLNLTAASYVIHLDPGWNPAVEDQATDRAHRIGQDKPVTVYRLVAQGTVEEAILALHADKRALVAGLLDGTGGAGAMTVQELVGLIEHGGREQADDPADPVTEAVAALAAASPVSPPPGRRRRCSPLVRCRVQMAPPWVRSPWRLRRRVWPPGSLRWIGLKRLARLRRAAQKRTGAVRDAWCAWPATQGCRRRARTWRERRWTS